MKIAILGGTGEQGPGLALRWAMAREEVIIGSRRQARAEQVAAELNTDVGELLPRRVDALRRDPRASRGAAIPICIA